MILSSRLDCPLSLKTPDMGNPGSLDQGCRLTTLMSYFLQLRAVNSQGSGRSSRSQTAKILDTVTHSRSRIGSSLPY